MSTSAGREAAARGTGVLSARQDAEARANIYGFLSAVYLHPLNEELVQRMADRDFLEELSGVFGRNPVAELGKCVAAAQPVRDHAYLKQEYMDLFVVPAGRYVTPFEDVYRGQTTDGTQARGPLLGERAIAATKIYREAGAEMDMACKELPTHIGVELAFMSFLCAREAADEDMGASGERYRELQTRFLRHHLNEWFPRLSRAIQEKAQSRMYRGLAMITEEFLSRDTSGLLASSVGSPEGSAERFRRPM